LASARPVRGTFVPLSSASTPAPLEWAVGTAPHWLVTLLGIDAPITPAPGGRTAPFAAPGIDGLQIELRRESSSDPDIPGLVLELTEGDGGELFDSHRLALADVRIPARATTHVWVRMPTLGRQIQRSLRLYSRSGELLDQRDPFYFLESVAIKIQATGAPPAKPFIVGDQSGPPSLPERMQALKDVEAQWEQWRGHGLRYRVVTDRRAMRRHVRQRLRRARSEILLIDPYFATRDNSDWEIVDGLRAQVRVLTGEDASRPTGAAPAVATRKWMTSPPPYHDRLWLIDGRAGLSIGASVNGLQGRRAYRVGELDPPEVAAWIAAFETWWGSVGATAI
jgi:hypothetical protein